MICQRHFDELDAGHRADQPSRRFANFLAVDEMAGILQGYAKRRRAWGLHRGGDAEVIEEFRDVADFLRKQICLREIVAGRWEELRIFLESRAASRGVGYDGINIFHVKFGVGAEWAKIAVRQIRG